MTRTKKVIAQLIVLSIFSFCFLTVIAQTNKKPRFHVIAFYTGRADLAHISFDHDANKWFPEMAKKYNFTYDSTKDWTNMNAKFLAKYQVVIFLDTRADDSVQRAAFQKYMENGGGWMGFHFSAFNLNHTDFPANWDWYHNIFLGTGPFVSNTWHPTPAILRVENHKHPVTKGLPGTIKTMPSEWYRWEKDLRQNPDIKILLSVDSSSFPLGNGPKQSEIWHSGYYPIVWTNKNFKMVYFNFGHNDMDYDHKTNATLSHTFESEEQNKLILNALMWVGTGKKLE